MDVQLLWHKSIILKSASATKNAIFTADLAEITDRSGVYLFFRSHGDNSEALYVGKANNLRVRIKQQLNNVNLMKGLENSASGSKRLVIGEFIGKKGLKPESILPKIEFTLIRHFVAMGHALLNKHGTVIERDSLTSDRTELKELIPRVIYFE